MNENESHYDVLDIRPEASLQEVREAYLKAKSAFSRDSVALYSLISAEEREEMLARIENAYEVLSDPEKRKLYDESRGGAGADFHPPIDIVSIDRVPPMDSGGEDLLVAPPTDFGAPSDSRLGRFEPPGISDSAMAAPSPMPMPITDMQPGTNTPVMPVSSAVERGEQLQVDRQLTDEIAQQTEFRGPFLKRVRESRRISIEEMATITKINKSYLLAIEEDNYTKLPAVVFVRGFVNQVARTLRLPTDKVVNAYLYRYSQARPEKSR
jgi:curved DNA-binding protein CbpA